MNAAAFLFAASLHGACETKAEKGICSCRLQKTSLLPNKINAVLIIITKIPFLLRLSFLPYLRQVFFPSKEMRTERLQGCMLVHQQPTLLK